VDLFNEYSVLLITWHMMCYTDFVLDPDTQWLVGWSMIVCICLNALVNIVIVLGVGGKLIYLVCLKYYLIFDRHHDNCCVRLLKLFGINPAENGPSNDTGSVSFSTSILNTLKDPFRADLSESDGGSALRPVEETLEDKRRRLKAEEN